MTIHSNYYENLNIGYIYYKLVNVSLEPDVRQVRHHVRDDFKPRILSQVKTFANSFDSVTAIGISCYVFVNLIELKTI